QAQSSIDKQRSFHQYVAGDYLFLKRGLRYELASVQFCLLRTLEQIPCSRGASESQASVQRYPSRQLFQRDVEGVASEFGVRPLVPLSKSINSSAEHHPRISHDPAWIARHIGAGGVGDLPAAARLVQKSERFQHDHRGQDATHADVVLCDSFMDLGGI